jgi:hypothetical protein
VLANLAEPERWWQRLDELLSVAGAVPGLAAILRVGAAAEGRLTKARLPIALGRRSQVHATLDAHVQP